MGSEFSIIKRGVMKTLEEEDLFHRKSLITQKWADVLATKFNKEVEKLGLDKLSWQSPEVRAACVIQKHWRARNKEKAHAEQQKQKAADEASAAEKVTRHAELSRLGSVETFLAAMTAESKLEPTKDPAGARTAQRASGVSGAPPRGHAK